MLRRFTFLLECANGHRNVVLAEPLPCCVICDTWEFIIVDAWVRGQPPWGERLRIPQDVSSGADTAAAFLQWLSYCLTTEHLQAPYGVRWLVPGVTQEVQDNRWVWLPCLAAS